MIRRIMKARFGCGGIITVGLALAGIGVVIWRGKPDAVETPSMRIARLVLGPALVLAGIGLPLYRVGYRNLVTLRTIAFPEGKLPTGSAPRLLSSRLCSDDFGLRTRRWHGFAQSPQGLEVAGNCFAHRAWRTT